MKMAVLVLDALALFAGAFILITTARVHGMRAAVHFVRLCCVVMGLFVLVQMRWSNLFDMIDGRDVLDDFMDVHNAVALTFFFYVMSIVILYGYDVWARRFGGATVNSATEKTSERSASPV